MARAKSAKVLPRYRTTAGTPNEREVAEHGTASPAKGWLDTRLKARKKWATRYSHEVKGQLTPIIEAIDSLNLTDAKKGREWEWRAHDSVSGVTFVFSLEVLW